VKAKVIRLWPEASNLFKTELLSISIGLWMYTRASPFSLALAMLVLTLLTLNHLKNYRSQFTWNELTSLKCSSPKFFRLILAGFILTNPIFSMNCFLNERVFQKKKENQEEATASSCLMLATALLVISEMTAFFLKVFQMASIQKLRPETHQPRPQELS